MTSRERVMAAVARRAPDRVPIDFGGTYATGMAADIVAKLRGALGLAAAAPVRVIDGYQMLGEIDEELRRALGVDTVSLQPPSGWFGYPNRDWKPWRLFDGTSVLVPGLFNTEPDERGDILQYPQGDRTAPACARMPQGGFYFDSIIRQPPFDEDALDPRDNLEEYGPVSEETLEYYRREAARLRRESDCAIIASFGGTGFGGLAGIPGMTLRHPKGIRDIEEWYVSLHTRRDYVYDLFAGQCEIALANLELFHQAVGGNVDIVFITGTDFGGQQGPLFSTAMYRELFLPFHARVNGWVHRETPWKTFIHSCGAVEPLIDSFIEAGFDILNPLQSSAAGMEPAHLKRRYGGRIALWGGGVDTQRTLPFGTPEAVRREVRERLETFSPGGGYVFTAVHNVQAGVPAANLLAMFEVLREWNRA